MESGNLLIVLDTTVLSNFLMVSQAELLSRLSVALCVVSPVIEEIKRGFEKGKIPEYPLDWLTRLELSDEETDLFERYRSRLGAGESAAIAVAYSRGLRLATDDMHARLFAIRLRIPLTGTIGILKACVTLKH